MPKARKRYNEQGQAQPCTVTVPDTLAVFLYRERKRGRFRDETELVSAIVRKWTDGLEPVDWPKLLDELKAEEDTAKVGKKESGPDAGKPPQKEAKGSKKK